MVMGVCLYSSCGIEVGVLLELKWIWWCVHIVLVELKRLRSHA